jgi:hypothetical protein
LSTRCKVTSFYMILYVIPRLVDFSGDKLLETPVPSAHLFERRKEDPIVYMCCKATLKGSLLCVTFLLAS